MDHEKFYTIATAIELLSNETKRLWTEQILLELAIHNGPALHAFLNKPYPVIQKLFDAHGQKVSQEETTSNIAVLSDKELVELLKYKKTFTTNPVGYSGHVVTSLPGKDDPHGIGEQLWHQSRDFSSPPPLSVEMVRVPAKFIENIINGKIAWPSNLQPSTDSPPPQPPLKKTNRQEEAILNCLEQLGYKPDNMPKQPSGKKGIKDEVRTKLLTKKELFSHSSFDKAWDRLSKNKLIKYQS